MILAVFETVKMIAIIVDLFATLGHFFPSSELGHFVPLHPVTFCVWSVKDLASRTLNKVTHFMQQALVTYVFL